MVTRRPEDMTAARGIARNGQTRELLPTTSSLESLDAIVKYWFDNLSYT